MDQNQDTSLFGMNIDQNGRAHLAEAARWGKFLAIIGFVVCGLVVLVGLFAGSFYNIILGQYNQSPYNEFPASSSGFGVIMAIYYIVIALIYFFPCLFLYRFATKMRTALAANDQELLNGSFQNLKATLRFIGILTLIGLVFLILAFLIAILGAATAGNF
jgi:hypothetical protein